MDKTQNNIRDYLSYLRDVSRKIVSNTGFERAYLPKTSKDFNSICDVSSSKQIPESDLIRFMKKTEQEPSNRLFIGFGLVIGKIDSKFVAGPIAYVECEVWGDEKEDNDCDFYDNILNLCPDTVIQYQPLQQSMVLNNDLFARLISSNNPQHEDEDDSVVNDSFEYSLELVSKFEDKITNLTKREISIDRMAEMVDSEVRSMITKSDSFRQIVPSDGDIDEIIECLRNRKRRKETYEDSEVLYYYKTALTFIARVPDQLSTYEVLNSFIEFVQTNNEGLKNPVLTNMLSKALGLNAESTPSLEYTNFLGVSSPYYNKSKVNQVKQVDDFISCDTTSKYIPSNLSNEQIRAIDMAWNSNLSYIQGPPGTGKSFTIYNIALSAHLMKKSVLIVSQKRPALYILPQFVKTQFNTGFVVDNLLKIYDFDSKAELRKALESTYRSIASDNNASIEVGQLEKQLESIKKNLKKKLSELSSLEESYRHALDLEQKAKAAHDKYILYRDTLICKYELNLEMFDPAKKRNLLQSISKTLEFTKRVITSHVTYRIKLQLYKIQEYFRNFNACFTLDISNIDELMDTYLSLCSCYEEYLQHKEALVNPSHMFRKKIDSIKQSNIKLQTQYLSLLIEINLKKRILDPRENIVQEMIRLLRYKKRSRIEESMRSIKYQSLLKIFPVWVSEIRNCNLFFPVTSGLFDMVVIDEASQVNLAEIIPVLYRGKRLCIVGDHNQLSLNSTGLTFHLSKSFDGLTWKKYFKKSRLSFSDACEKNLTVIKSSILDFIKCGINMINPPEVMLTEHYRSHPILAKFTSDKFYSDDKQNEGLKIMTATYNRYADSAFHLIKTQGRRNKDRVIKEESDIILSCLRSLITKNSIDYMPKSVVEKADLTVGVLCFLRSQCEYIKSAMYSDNEIKSQIDKYGVLVGTAEEFQGNEKDLMLISFSLNSDNKRSSNFYNYKNRFNVATSRARLFTIAVYSGVPNNFDLVKKYFQHFLGEGFSDFEDASEISQDQSVFLDSFSWKLDVNKYESEFEREVYNYLREYSAEKQDIISIYNQVEACGQKRLDFVLVNESNHKCVAVEVDGAYHFVDKAGFIYNAAHEERIGALRRAGWNIVNTPFNKWYNHGWLSDIKHKVFSDEIERIHRELDGFLF